MDLKYPIKKSITFSVLFIRLSISNDNLSTKSIIFFGFYAYQSYFSQLDKYDEKPYLKIKIFFVLFVHKKNDNKIGFFALNPKMHYKLNGLLHKSLE